MSAGTAANRSLRSILPRAIAACCFTDGAPTRRSSMSFATRGDGAGVGAPGAAGSAFNAPAVNTSRRRLHRHERDVVPDFGHAAKRRTRGAAQTLVRGAQGAAPPDPRNYLRPFRRAELLVVDWRHGASVLVTASGLGRRVTSGLRSSQIRDTPMSPLRVLGSSGPKRRLELGRNRPPRAPPRRSRLPCSLWSADCI